MRLSTDVRLQPQVDSSIHPGGLQMTERLGELLGLQSGMVVLDVELHPEALQQLIHDMRGKLVGDLSYAILIAE